MAKIKTRNLSDNHPASTVENIEDYVEKSLLQNESNTDIEDQVELVAQSVGRLTELLVEKGIFDAKEVVYIATSLTPESQSSYGMESELVSETS